MRGALSYSASLCLLPALLVLTACAGSAPVTNPYEAGIAQRNEFRLHVQNDNFYDARIYTISSTGRRQLGYVTGKTDGVFTVPWTFSQDLRVEIDMQAGPRCTTESISVDPGDELRLQIMSSIIDTDFCRDRRPG